MIEQLGITSQELVGKSIQNLIDCIHSIQRHTESNARRQLNLPTNSSKGPIHPFRTPPWTQINNNQTAPHQPPPNGLHQWTQTKLMSRSQPPRAAYADTKATWILLRNFRNNKWRTQWTLKAQHLDWRPLLGHLPSCDSTWCSTLASYRDTERPVTLQEWQQPLMQALWEICTHRLSEDPGQWHNPPYLPMGTNNYWPIHANTQSSDWAGMPRLLTPRRSRHTKFHTTSRTARHTHMLRRFSNSLHRRNHRIKLYAPWES